MQTGLSMIGRSETDIMGCYAVRPYSVEGWGLAYSLQHGCLWTIRLL
jgi:hypothetical protein